MSIISNIRGAIASGIARPNRYSVYISDLYFGGFGTRDFSALIQESELPGKGFATTERQTFGPVRKMPYQVLYNDITMSILCTKYMLERRFFDYWMSQIMSPGSHYFDYYDNYTVPILISQFAEDGAFSVGYLLMEAYPVSVASQPLSFANTDSTLQLSVTFAYRKWLTFPDQLGELAADSGIPDDVQQRLPEPGEFPFPEPDPSSTTPEASLARARSSLRSATSSKKSIMRSKVPGYDISGED